MHVSIPIALTSTLALGAAVFALPTGAAENGTENEGEAVAPPTVVVTEPVAPAAAEPAPSAEPAAGPAFAVTDSLAADHPLVRAQTLQQEQSDLEDEIKSMSDQRRELADELRSTREEAREALGALHETAVAEARKFLHERRDALKARVDAELAKSRLDPMRALRMDLAGPLSAERANGLSNGIHDVAHAIEAGLPMAFENAESSSPTRVASDVSRVLHDRVQKSWKRLAERRDTYAQALGPKHDERADWAAERVEKLRSELHERIDCGVERSLDRYSKSLHKRLHDFDVPTSAECQAALEDVAAQLEGWADGFLVGTDRALTTYEAQVAAEREPLGAKIDANAQRAEAALTTLSNSVDAVLAKGAPTLPDAKDESGRTNWRRGDALRRHLADLRHEMRGDAHAARDVIRPAADAIERALEDEERIADEAWRDLREALSGFASRAAENCWKLDGPHLDGRHAPKAKTGEKFVEAAPQRRARRVSRRAGGSR